MKRIYYITVITLLCLLSSIGYSKKLKHRKNFKILFVVTSHDKLGETGKKTGLWIEEFATPYFFLKDMGIEVVVASPKGGQAPIDPKSNLSDFQTEATKRFYADPQAQAALRETRKLSLVKEGDFDAVFYPGGHGPLWDLSRDKNSIQLIESFYNHGKPIAFVCHAPAALQNVKDKSGQPLVKGKKVTGFANSEEEAVQLTKIVPFLVEDMLKEKGAIYQKGKDWTPFTLTDGLLITGQNPQSSYEVAQTLLKILKNK
ncbi:type 1 glutamine amidotransferase domain-containing protein [Xanthovirga aplysinae]|uniref:type 1 glutamine amidotransferase domain-containing protein n=1 Tax=Xanthovirga aplysinae TaxID=2529853 RepID=UPI0012BD2293|nr:type 1 glutamine amidotransferase domain-containing protein [Xanthovirga aplysinae]MTI31266.1 type 1 glutamine amidotransferase domain-containing protein [Xanthovirga aplysinae]